MDPTNGYMQISERNITEFNWIDIIQKVKRL